MNGITSGQIKEALARMHGNREFFIAECKSGPSDKGYLRFDAAAIYKSWAHPQIRGYEIKVSRSDFLQDAKYAQYLPYFHEFYFVTPYGMVQRQEIEENIGLIWYNHETGALTTKKKAVHRNIEVNADMLLYIIMNRLSSDRTPFHSTQADYWRDWLAGKINDRELGYKVNSRLLEIIKEQRRKIDEYSHRDSYLDELKAIRKVMDKHGLCNSWRDDAEVIDEALSKPYPPEIHKAIDDVKKCAQAFERFESGSKLPDEGDLI